MHSTSMIDQRKAAGQGAVIGGVDVAQGWHFIHGLGSDGMSIGKPLKFANTRSGFEAMWARRPTGRRLVGGIESTGPYWMPLAHWLRQKPGVTIVLVNPLHTHKLKEVDDHTPSKHDAKDAGIIARAVADARYMHWRPREGVWSEWTTLSVTRPCGVGDRAVAGRRVGLSPRGLGGRAAWSLKSSRRSEAGAGPGRRLP